MFRNQSKLYSFIVVVIDMALVNLGFYLAFMAKFGFNPPWYNLVSYVEIIPFITIAALVYFDIYGLLSVFEKSLYDTLYSIIFAIIPLGITTIAITYFNQRFSFPRSVLLMAPVLQIALIFIWRVFVWKTKKRILASKKVVVIGTSTEEMQDVINKIKAPSSNMLMEIRYMCDNRDMDEAFKQIDLSDEVFMCSSVPNEDRSKIIGYCINNRKGIYIVPDVSEILFYKSQMLQFDDIPTFAIEGLQLSIGQRFFKRMFDIVVSFVGIILLSPVMVISALVVKLTSKGKAIYSQTRVTRNGKKFKLYKFRTMVEDAEKGTGPVMSVEGDSRITPAGRVMRKLRLDELPQLFNVLKGDMSIVGPRPERPYFVEQFVKEIPGYEYRASVKSGITGLAQVLGKYTTSPEDKLRYDLLYIKNYSILFDIKIILQTIKVAFVAHSAEGFNREIQQNFKLTING